MIYQRKIKNFLRERFKSKYDSATSFQGKIQSNNVKTQSIRVIISNVRGVIKNWDIIQKINTENYDVIMFNEIWQIREFENLKIDNFVLANVFTRDQTRGGGSMIFIRETIAHQKIDSPKIEGLIETCAVTIGDTHFVSLYRPPSGSKIEFVEELTNWIERVGRKNIYIAGDFNINCLNSDKVFLENITESTGLIPEINEPTRISSNTCIDNILTNVKGNHSVSSLCIADHQALTSKIDITNIAKKMKEQSTYREMSEANWSKFKIEINKLKIRGLDIENKWSNLCDDIKESVEKSFPLKTRKVKYSFSMSQGLLKSKNRKNKLLKKYKRGEIAKEVYIAYNKVYRKLIMKEQEKAFNEKISECGSDSKKRWSTLKSHLKISKSTDNVEKLIVNDESITDKQKIAESFKTHFETCAQKLAESVPNSTENNILIDQQEEWEFTSTNIDKVTKCIDSLQTKNSCGFDLLSNRMIKKEKNLFAKLLTPLINETLAAGVFPTVLKKAIVIPIFKKGDKTKLDNYRPISLLPVLSKVLEKIINNQITEKLDELKLIDENQYGFRVAHSTEDALIKFVDALEKAKATNKTVISIHIDVSKAFDSCDHTILRSKLQRIGIAGKSLDLLTSYMKDRKQEVWIETKCGGSFVINIGVGQGTILGPTFFKIYIIDMYRATSLFSIRFADDTNLIGAGGNKELTEELVNNELEKLYKWFCSNKLTLHPNKSRFIVYSKDKLVNIKLGGQNLMRCGYGLQEEGVKFLGVIIDENLDWKLHVKYVKKKIGKGNYLLWRYKKSLSIAMKRTIYESFIRCHLLYCLIVWGAKKTQSLAELKTQIKKIWTKIGIRKQHTNERLVNHEILKLEDELKIAEIKTIWRWEKNKIPTGIKDIIVERNNNLRNRNFLRERSWKQDSIAYRLATRATKEIKEIEIAKSKKGLAKKYRNKCFLIEYVTPCRVRNCFICRD